MRNKNYIKNLIMVIAIAGTILVLSLLNLTLPKESYSYSERRQLSRFPHLTLESIASGSYMKDFETASTDRFFSRDIFRRIKGISSCYLLGRKDNNGYYMYRDYLGKGEELNLSRLNRNLATLKQIYQEKVEVSDCNSYICIIPDKNMYIMNEAFSEGKSVYPGIDYEYMYDYLYEYAASNNLGEWIDIREELTLADYYKTDQHWRQENIEAVAGRLAESLKADIAMEYDKKTLEQPFYGTYYGQAALPAKGESLSYLDSELFDKCVVTSYSSGSPKATSIYTLTKSEGKDPYEIFLGGADPLIVIENPESNTDRELVVFRDSFGSSLVPLLVPGYAKITMVDLRYMQKEMLNSLIEFSNQDVLFLYSTLILNNSISVK